MLTTLDFINRMEYPDRKDLHNIMPEADVSWYRHYQSCKKEVGKDKTITTKPLLFVL